MLTQGETLRERYKIIRRLGQGGMGAVYEAHDNVFDTSVAVKEVILDLSSTHNTKAQEMAQHAFEREAKILAKVNHENIPHVKDYFTEDDSQFLIMELVDGDDLAKLLQEQRKSFPVETVIEWTDSLLDALDYLHSQDPPIIHRDIKPQNLKLTSRKKIKLLDFGIAKGTEANAANTVANQTFVAATLNYSPIEQMLRVLDPTFLAVITHKYSEKIEKFLEQNADVRSDLYALGATLYHLVTNVSPAEAVKRSIEIWDGKPDPLENPSKLNPEIPAEFSQFLLKSMEIKREDRYGTAAEMREALRGFAEFGTKPSLVPTVELNMDDFKTNEDGIDLEATSAKTFVLENPPNTGGEQPTNTDPSNAEAQTPPTPLESTSPSDSNVTEEIVTEVGKPRVNTGQQFNQQVVSLSSQGQTGGQTHQTQPPKQKKKSNLKFLLLIPVFGLLFLLVGGAAGAFYYINYVAGKDTPTANTNTNQVVEDDGENNSNSIQSDVPIGQGDILTDGNTSSDDSNTETNSTTTTSRTPTTSKTPATKSTPRTVTKATPKPTRKATPRPTPRTIVAKPTPRRTPKPRRTPRPRRTPKKDMNCIFTDDC